MKKIATIGARGGKTLLVSNYLSLMRNSKNFQDECEVLYESIRLSRERLIITEERAINFDENQTRIRIRKMQRKNQIQTKYTNKRR